MPHILCGRKRVSDRSAKYKDLNKCKLWTAYILCMFRINAIRVELNVSVRDAIYQLSISASTLMLRFSGTLTCMDLKRS